MRTCKEIKRYLSGAEMTYPCQLIALEENFGILRYIIRRRWQVHTLTIWPDTETLAFYWTDRPYNLYWWIDPRGNTIGHYFNLADSVCLSREAFIWRDLVIDILAQPVCSDERVGAAQHLDRWDILVLDEHELPADIDPKLEAYIRLGKRQILSHYPEIIHTARAALQRYRIHTSLALKGWQT